MSVSLTQTLAAIQPVSNALAPAIQARLDDLTKPPGSLGMLEAVARRYCMIRATLTPGIPRKRIVCFGADHGVVAEGVSAFPAEVTAQMIRNMLGGGAAINVLARHAGADLRIVDIGVNDPLDGAPSTLCRRKIRSGTGNIAIGPAMTQDEARKALEVGIACADEATRDGITLLAAGDMGIGNTTPSTALYCALLHCHATEITGRGTGLDDAGVRHKIAVIEKALAVNQAGITDPLAALAAVGGLEIAGIAGLMLGAAANHIPTVVDGFIATAGATVAIKLAPAAADCLLFSHRSREQGHMKILELLGASPLLDLELRLGEGTGAALAMTLVDAALKIYTEMSTFSAARISQK